MKRVLIISYYFPPSGGPGVQRVLKFTRYLPKFGWLPTVLTVEPAFAAYPALDPSLEQEVPPEVNVIRTRSWDPYGLYAHLQRQKKQNVVDVGFVKEQSGSRLQALARWVRGNIFLPDARVGWVPYATRAARSLFRSQAFDAVITSGPPHSAHLIGQRIHKRTATPWIIDMRDPWVEFCYNVEMKQSRLARAIQTRMERRVLECASAVVSVSDFVGQRLKHRARIRHYETIYNGFDPADYPRVLPQTESNRPFIIAHVGSFTRSQHVPSLLQALQQLESTTPVEMHFVGHIHEEALRAYRETGLEVVIKSYMPHSEAVAYMQKADLLLVALGRWSGAKGIVTGKVFEYLSASKPILGIGPVDGDLANILSQTRGGRVFDYGDAKGMAGYIKDRINRRTESFEADETALKMYNRRELTHSLAQLLTSITSNS